MVGVTDVGWGFCACTGAIDALMRNKASNRELKKVITGSGERCFIRYPNSNQTVSSMKDFILTGRNPIQRWFFAAYALNRTKLISAGM